MTKHKPVNKAMAQDCMAQYKKSHQSSEDPAVKSAFTDGVIFDKTELIAWLNAIPTPSIKISLGVYTAEFAQKYPGAKEGRLTTFIFPSTIIPSAHVVAAGGPGDNGGPPPDLGSDPFNMGELHP